MHSRFLDWLPECLELLNSLQRTFDLKLKYYFIPEKENSQQYLQFDKWLEASIWILAGYVELLNVILGSVCKLDFVTRFSTDLHSFPEFSLLCIKVSKMLLFNNLLFSFVIEEIYKAIIWILSGQPYHIRLIWRRFLYTWASITT